MFAVSTGYAFGYSFFYNVKRGGGRKVQEKAFPSGFGLSSQLALAIVVVQDLFFRCHMCGLPGG